MPISFKPSITATFYRLTPTEDLVLCPVCGGVNAMGRVSKKVDCTACSQTGYSNYYAPINLPVYHTPRSFTRWNANEGGLTRFGDAQIKLDSRYEDIVEGSKYVRVKGADWNFERVHVPGGAFGQERLILALTRR
jgi:hypothetical protein